MEEQRRRRGVERQVANLVYDQEPVAVQSFEVGAGAFSVYPGKIDRSAGILLTTVIDGEADTATGDHDCPGGDVRPSGYSPQPKRRTQKWKGAG